jgi:hypothetical protein
MLIGVSRVVMVRLVGKYCTHERHASAHGRLIHPRHNSTAVRLEPAETRQRLRVLAHQKGIVGSRTLSKTEQWKVEFLLRWPCLKDCALYGPQLSLSGSLHRIKMNEHVAEAQGMSSL